MSISIKSAIHRAAQVPGVYFIIRKLKAGPIVLFYHGVEEQIIDPRVQTLHIPFHHFEKQIAYLRKYFDIISLDHFCDCLSNGHKIDPSQIIMTFDDGYKNNLNIVAPYLEAHDIPFSVFVSTRHITEGRRFPTYYLRASVFYSRDKHAKILNEEFDISTHAGKQSTIGVISKKLKHSPQKIAEQIVEDLIGLLPKGQWLELNHRFSSDEPMNWDEVKQLHDRGVVIGSHCHDHFILHNKQSMEEIDDQLQTSKALVQEHVGECKYIAYPNGGMSDIFPDAVASVRANQYLAGLTTIAGEVEAQTNPYILPRIGAHIEDMPHFKFTINTGFRHNRDYRKWAGSWLWE